MRKLYILTSVLLFLAMFDLPISYYTFLRIIVSIVAGYTLYSLYEGKLTSWIIVFGVIFILFNPLIPIYLYDKSVWIPIDLISSGIFVYKFANYKRVELINQENKEDNKLRISKGLKTK